MMPSKLYSMCRFAYWCPFIVALYVFQRAAYIFAAHINRKCCGSLNRTPPSSRRGYYEAAIQSHIRSLAIMFGCSSITVKRNIRTTISFGPMPSTSFHLLFAKATKVLFGLTAPATPSSTCSDINDFPAP